jgi:hypothetical protein
MEVTSSDDWNHRIYTLEKEMKIIKEIVVACVAGGSFLFTLDKLTNTWKIPDGISSIIAFLIAIIAVAYTGWHFGRAARRPQSRSIDKDCTPDGITIHQA